MAGGVLTVGIEREIGIGDLFFDLSVALSSHSSGLVELDPGGLALSAGYRFHVF
jgi:hypothetical protein